MLSLEARPQRQELLEPLLAEGEPVVDVLMLAARIEYLFGRYERAEEFLHRVLEREPNNTGAAAKLGFIQDGLISHNFLRAYAWTLDFERMRMVFTR